MVDVGNKRFEKIAAVREEEGRLEGAILTTESPVKKKRRSTTAVSSLEGIEVTPVEKLAYFLEERGVGTS